MTGTKDEHPTGPYEAVRDSWVSPAPVASAAAPIEERRQPATIPPQRL